MIEETLERIAVSLEELVKLYGRSDFQARNGLIDQLVPDTLGTLTPNIPPPPADGPPKNLFPSQAPADGPAHHTGTYVAPPPADADDNDDSLPSPGDGEGPDSAGHFWDARIHSKARTKVKNTGEWKLLRGVDKTLVAAVFAEQTGAVTTPPPAVTPTSTPAGPPAGPTPGATPAPTIKDFVAKVVAAGYTAETMQPFLAAHGIAGLPFLISSSELIPVILAEMGLV